MSSMLFSRFLPEKPPLNEEELAFSEHAKSSRPSIDIWQRLANRRESNDIGLAHDMEKTIFLLATYVTKLEEDHKKKTFRRDSLGSEEYANVKGLSDKLFESLTRGLETIQRLHTIAPRDLYSDEKIRVGEYNDVERRKVRDRILELNDHIDSLTSKFAQLCEVEGIEHNLPLPKVKPKQKFFKLPPPPKSLNPSEVVIPTLAPERPPRPPTAQLVKYVRKRPGTPAQLQVEIRTPVGFLEAYARRDNLDFDMTLVKVEKNALFTEFVYSCKVMGVVGEGRGRSKVSAKQNAASQLMKIMIGKQRRGTLPEELRELGHEEIDLAVSLMCEAVDYESELSELCAKTNSRPPIFSIVTGPANINVVRCKALGVNAVGRGRTKEIARRVAAKIVLDQVAETKRKTKEIGKDSFLPFPQKPLTASEPDPSIHEKTSQATTISKQMIETVSKNIFGAASKSIAAAASKSIAAASSRNFAASASRNIGGVAFKDSISEANKSLKSIKTMKSSNVD